jgi:hypothetical protein
MQILVFIICAIAGLIYAIVSLYKRYHIPKAIRGPYGHTKYIISYGAKGVIISNSRFYSEAIKYPNLNETEKISHDELFKNWSVHPKTEQILKSQRNLF